MSRTPAEPHGGTGTARERLSDLAETIGAEKLDRYQEVLAQLEPRQLVALVARLERAQSWDQVAKVVGPDSADDARATVTEALCGLAGAEGSDLEEVALAVADRLAIDWPARLDQAKDEHEREVLEQLRLADEVAEACWTQPTSPKRLGDFEILRELGRGGMGVVYEARQISLKRRVALKVLPPALGMGSHARQRFEREAQAAAKLHHTNIVPVHAIGEHDGHHFYAMDLIEGQSLDHVLLDLADEGSNPLLDQTVTRAASELTQERPAPTESTHAMSSQGGDVTSSLGDTSAGSRPWFDAVAKLIAEVADGLDYAHGRGVIHRDIKPANLMLSGEGRLCITDFGLARIVQEPGMTVSGSFLGTPAYMSPEQIAAGRMKLDHRTDVYSLGAVLYELLTLHRPFPGDSREEVIGAIMTKDPRAPRKFNGKIPQDLETICLKALEKDPDRRYATAGAFAQDLREYLRHGLIAAKRAGLLRRAGKSIRRHPVVSTVTLSAVLLVALAILSGKLWTGMQEADIGRMASDARQQVTRGQFREAMATVEDILSADPDNVDALLIRARTHMHRKRMVDSVADARQVLQQVPEHWEAHALIAAAGSWGHIHSIPVGEHLRNAENGAPDTADAAYLRGLIATYSWGYDQDRGDLGEAIHWLTETLAKDPGQALALEARSDAYLVLLDFPAALADAERLITALPKWVDGYCQKSLVLRKMHDLEGALQAVDRAIEIEPDANCAYGSRAALRAAQGNRSMQLEDLSRIVELAPRRRNALRNRGIQLRNAGRYDAAAIDLRRCIEINPDNASCYQHLFWTHWFADKREEAIGVLEELEKRAEQWVSAEGKYRTSRMKADYYRETGEFELAEEEADRIIELIPHKLDGYSLRLRFRRLLRDDAGIEEDCDLIAALDLYLPGALLNRANLLQNSCNRENAALECYAEVIEMAPSWAHPLRDRAQLHRNAKRYDDALADLEKAIELAPAWVDPYYARARVHAAMERHEEALVDYERCVELGSNSFDLREYQADSLARLGRDEDALQAIQEYIDENPANVGGWMQRAILLYNMGRVKEAIAALDHALEIRPGHDNTRMFRVFYGAFDPRSCAAGAKALQEYAKRDPDHPITWSSIAYVHNAAFYYLCPEQYDPDLALEYAEKAARFDSRSDFYQLGHALALYRHGRSEEAQEILVRVLEIVHQPNSDSLFLLSMTHARLGSRAEARRYYDQAVERMEEDRDRRPDTTLFRAEAAELLGIQP